MVYEVVKTFIVGCSLVVFSAVVGIAWSRLPILNPDPQECHEKVNLYGEVKSCPAGMILELAGTSDIAYVICHCPDESGENKPELKSGEMTTDDDQPLESVPIPEHTGIRL